MDLSPVAIFFTVVAVVWTPPVVLGAIFGRRASTRERAVIRAGAIAYGISFMCALGWVVVVVLLLGIGSGKTPVGEILMVVGMWGVVPAIMAGLGAYLVWKPLPNSHSPLVRNLDWVAPTPLALNTRGQVPDAIQAARQETMERPAKD